MTSKKSQIISTRGSAADFHARPIPTSGRPQIWVHQVAKPAVVLGSTQIAELLDADRLLGSGYEITKRRSGGGVVVIHPESSLWVDVIVPPTHELWSDDVGRAFFWVGQAWARALFSVGVTDITVHEGPATNPDLGRLVCFGSVGSGEVLAGQSKVVGLSQRRTRDGARFQCIALQRWNATETESVFAGKVPALADVEVGANFDRKDLLSALISELELSLFGGDV